MNLTRDENFEIQDLLKFSDSYPCKPFYPKATRQKFLTEFVSGRKMIFDIHAPIGRVGVAALLDKINNPSNDACLEVLGLRSGMDVGEVYAYLLKLAREQVPKSRNGIQISFHDSFAITEAFLSVAGLSHFYDTYGMRNPNILEVNVQDEPKVLRATQDDCDQVYETLCLSFADNPETSIPDGKTWKSGFLKSSKSQFFLWKNQSQVLGFANLTDGDDGLTSEIRTIGVLPEARGLGIGKRLLRHCLKDSAKRGFKKSHLSVAVQNENALSLYTKVGFQITDKYKTYRTDNPNLLADIDHE